MSVKGTLECGRVRGCVWRHACQKRKGRWEGEREPSHYLSGASLSTRGADRGVGAPVAGALRGAGAITLLERDSESEAAESDPLSEEPEPEEPLPLPLDEPEPERDPEPEREPLSS